MKKLGLVLLTLAVAGCNHEQKAVDLSDDDKKIAYSIGYSIGERVKDQLPELSIDALIVGVREAYTESAEPKMTEEERNAVLQAFQQKKMEENKVKAAEAEAKAKEDRAKAMARGETNKKAGEAFLAENAKKEGVVTLESGLQYKVETAGTGASPLPTEKIEVHYHGTLIDGTVFDSSIDRGEPASFVLSKVIKGWTEGLQLMKVGGEWELYVPSNLAYGASNGPGGPNSTLIFKVKLLGIAKPTPEAAK